MQQRQYSTPSSLYVFQIFSGATPQTHFWCCDTEPSLLPLQKYPGCTPVYATTGILLIVSDRITKHWLFSEWCSRQTYAARCVSKLYEHKRSILVEKRILLQPIVCSLNLEIDKVVVFYFFRLETASWVVLQLERSLMLTFILHEVVKWQFALNCWFILKEFRMEVTNNTDCIYIICYNVTNTVSN